MREISGSQLADLTGKTWRTVKSLLETAGVQPKRRDGRSDLYDSTVALRAIYAPESSAEFDDQRQRLAAAQSEKVEHENALRRGQLAARVDVERFWTECIANARAKALSMSSKLSPRLVNIGDAGIIAAAIRAEVYAFLAELADYEPSERSGMDPVSEPGVGAAAGPDGGRVGRPRKTPVNGKQRRARPVANG
jgi:hypothetical protein